MGVKRDLVLIYGAFSTSDFVEVDGPYATAIDFGSVSLSFSLIVKASEADDFADRCAALERALSRRDQSISIVVDGEVWAKYTFGGSALNTSCEVSKGGTRETDTGRSRSYTATFHALLPADDNQGFFSINSSISYAPTRQKTVSITGEARGLGGQSALDVYEAGIEGKEGSILTLIDSSAHWELVAEDRTFDRTNHVLTYSRTNTELLYENPGGWEDKAIVAQGVQFRRASMYPGDSDAETNRPERIVIEYTTFVDKEETTGDEDLSTLYEETIYPWLMDRFVAVFDPSQFAVVEHGRDINPTANSINARIVVMAYMKGGDLLAYTETEERNDARTIDYTPVWDGGEFSAYVDQQFIVRLRSKVITKTVLGEADNEEEIRDGEIQKSGWNKIQSSQSKTEMWVGEGEDRVRVTNLTTQLVERYTTIPSGGDGYTVAKPHPETRLGSSGRSGRGGSIPGARAR